MDRRPVIHQNIKLDQSDLTAHRNILSAMLPTRVVHSSNAFDRVVRLSRVSYLLQLMRALFSKCWFKYCAMVSFA